MQVQNKKQEAAATAKPAYDGRLRQMLKRKAGTGRSQATIWQLELLAIEP